MRTVLKLFAALLLLFLGAFVVFYFWAGSPAISEDKLATVHDYGVSGRPAATPKDQYTIVTYNVGYFSGMANNLPFALDKDFVLGNLQKAAEVLAQLDPDIIAMQEIDFEAARTSGMDQLAYLAAAINKSPAPGPAMRYGAKTVNWNKTYVPFPYWPISANFGRMVSGLAILSRYPLSGLQRHVLAKRGDKPFYYQRFYIDRMAECAIVDVGRPLAVINVHLESWDRGTRAEQIQQVAGFVREMRQKAPVILLGDFNTVPIWAAQKTGFPDEFQDYTDEKTLLVVMNDLGLKPAIGPDDCPGDQRATLTFPSAAPTRKVDHIFYDPKNIEIVSWGVVSEAGSASDHLPLMMKFRFK